jgi:hypothetical protein
MTAMTLGGGDNSPYPTPDEKRLGVRKIVDFAPSED